MLPVRRIVALCIAFAGLGLSGAASAQAGSGDAKSQHTVVVWVEGGGKKDVRVREAIGESLPSSVRVVDDAAFRKAMIASGQKLPFSPLLGKGPFRKGALDRTRKALKELGAEGAILANIRIGKGGQEVVILYVEAGDAGGDPAVEAPILLSTADLRGSIAKSLDAQILAWGAGSAAPSPPAREAEPKKDDQPKEEEAPKEDDGGDDDEPTGEGRPKNQYGRELFSMLAAYDLGGRWFSYNDPFSNNLRDYEVVPASGIALGAEVYPLATTDVAILKDLGIVGGFGTALGLASTRNDNGDEVTTSWLHFDAGLRFRLRTGSEGAPVLGLHGGFAMNRFDFDADPALAAEVPSVAYGYLKVGIDGRIPLGPVALGLFFDYLGAISAGEVYDRFTEPSIGGIAAGGSFIVPIAAGFEARLGAEYQRWFYAFVPVVGDAYVAGGALDEYLHVTVGPAYVY